MISPRLAADKRFWICLEADGHCVGGVVWGAPAGEAARLSSQAQELLTIANGWALALRTAQIREEARGMAEQLAETNRRLQDAQGEILRSRTMIAVGEMAAGAAHEMNNPLAVISGRSQLLAQQLTDPKVKAAAHLIHEQAHRLSAIITELMDFAKPEAPVIDHSEVAEVIDRALHEAKTNNDPADRKIEVTLSDLPLVAVDARQVSAAITEVIENAIHATEPQTGQIHVHCGYDPYSSRVVVTVTDNGCGMDDKTVKRAFDPFFSAKPAGRRRGLGLAKALRWIEASGGSIRLESRPGQGTRTVILLSAVARRRELHPARVRMARKAAGELKLAVLAIWKVTRNTGWKPVPLLRSERICLPQRPRPTRRRICRACWWWMMSRACAKSLKNSHIEASKCHVVCVPAASPKRKKDPHGSASRFNCSSRT